MYSEKLERESEQESFSHLCTTHTPPKTPINLSETFHSSALDSCVVSAERVMRLQANQVIISLSSAFVSNEALHLAPLTSFQTL